MAEELPEAQGRVAALSPKGGGLVLDTYEGTWFNKGKDLRGAWPTVTGEFVTITYETTIADGGIEKYWVREIWPTSGPRTQPGPQPTNGPTSPTPTQGPAPTEPPAPTGPTPAPVGPTLTLREDGITWANAINASVACLQANLDYNARKSGDTTPLPIQEERVLSFARKLYAGRPWAEPEDLEEPPPGEAT